MAFSWKKRRAWSPGVFVYPLARASQRGLSGTQHTGHSPKLSLFTLLLTSPQLSTCAPSTRRVASSEISFWLPKKLWAHPKEPLTLPRNPPLLKPALAPLTEKWYLETKFGASACCRYGSLVAPTPSQETEFGSVHGGLPSACAHLPYACASARPDPSP